MLMDVTESQDQVAAHPRTASSSDGRQSADGNSQGGTAQPSPFAALQLDEARRSLEGENPQVAKSLDHVLHYRDLVLEAGEPDLLSDTLPLIRAIEARSLDRAVTERARHFVASTIRRMADWPEQARAFELEDLQGRLEAVQDRQGRMVLRILPLATLVVSVAGIVLSAVVAPRIATDRDTWNLIGLIMIPTGVVLASLLEVSRRAREASLKAQADNLERKLSLRRLPGSLDETYTSETQRAAATPGGEYFGNLVRINVDNLSDYYTQVRVHTNNSFWASIAAGGLGFLLIVAGLILGYTKGDTQAISFVATGSGVVVEFISGVFFYLYNRTVRQLKDYHDSLLDVQNILLSFRIVEQAVEEQRGSLFEKILDFLLKQRAGASQQ